jgi:hypothetical protein
VSDDFGMILCSFLRENASVDWDSGGSFPFQSISNASYGSDHCGAGASLAQSGTQALDRTVHDARISMENIAPHLTEKLFARQHLACMA